ncbi:MAG: histidine phosphatase family protein [Saprospiraceae bacterium]|nr:histidine phosphatase family protein [Saprospiraceae bacterium]
MRTLFLIRHAKSSWDNPGLRDINRPLNDRGMHDAPRMAQLLAGIGPPPDLIVSSPAKRAFTTAMFFARAFGIDEDGIEQKQEIYEAAPRDILRLVSALPDNAHTVCLFGHNPTFTEVANRFSENYIDNVPTCGIVHVKSEADTWAGFDESNAVVKACYFPKLVL